MRFAWVMLKYFCGFAALVGMYVVSMPGGIGYRLAAVVFSAGCGAGWWWSGQRLVTAVPVVAAAPVEREPQMEAFPVPVDIGWARMPVRHAGPVYMHTMDGWGRR